MNVDDDSGDRYAQCVVHQDCRSRSRPRAVCVDGQCCTQPSGNNNNGRRQQNDWESNAEQEDDDDFDDVDDIDDDDSAMMDDDGQNTFVDDNPQQQSRRQLLQRGRQICRNNGGLRYQRVVLCSQSRLCPSQQQYVCIRGHCCLRNFGGRGVDGYVDADDEDDDGIIANGNRATRSHCQNNRGFTRFLGGYCQRSSDCISLLTSFPRLQQQSVRCIRGECCATGTTANNRQRRRRQHQDGNDIDDWDDDLLPIRSRGSSGWQHCGQEIHSLSKSISPSCKKNYIFV